MIVVVSSTPREANAIAAIASHQPRPACICSSVAEFRARLRTAIPSVVVTRVRLDDGYSDDVLALLAESGRLPGTKVIALAEADCTSGQEARQLSLGADCVLRDPLRPVVLSEYLGKFLRQRVGPPVNGVEIRHFLLAGVTVMPENLQIQRGKGLIHISPKEIALARMLAESNGKLLTYDLLYDELFHRTFSGDSANMRVLLAKLAASWRRLGVDLRAAIRVTPKTGVSLPAAGGRAARAVSG